MHKSLITIAALAASLSPMAVASAGTGDARGSAGSPQGEEKEVRVKRDNPPLCYQEFCLGDHIRKLAEVTGGTASREVNIDLKARPDILEDAKGIYIGPSVSVATIASRGFAGIPGERHPYGVTPLTPVRSQVALSALQSVETLCDTPQRFASVTSTARNGKQVHLTYRVATLNDGSSHFVLDVILVSYPGLKSPLELQELAEKASEALAAPLTCEFRSNVGCNTTGHIQEMEIRPVHDTAYLTLRYGVCLAGDCEDYGLKPRFSLDEARRHPACREEISF